MKGYLYIYMDSPLGEIEIKYDEKFIHHIYFMKEGHEKKVAEESTPDFVDTAITELKSYFEGTLKKFELPLYFGGTDFQNKVWKELSNIPFAKTISYMQMAKKLGDVKNIRAAASANGKNPFAIVVPCHRVIGSDGSLTGYAGELWRKQWLLEHEAKVAGVYQTLF